MRESLIPGFSSIFKLEIVPRRSGRFPPPAGETHTVQSTYVEKSTRARVLTARGSDDVRTTPRFGTLGTPTKTKATHLWSWW
jgi:hypothetical protein